MPHFSTRSKKTIATLHKDIQDVLYTAIEIVDFSVLDGLRGEEAQNAAVANGRSKATYPKSRHNRSRNDDGTYNTEKSDAVDIAPFPIKWPDIRKQTTMEYVKRMGAFYMLAGVILTVAYSKGVKLRWGGSFKGFFDGPHFERVAE
jgi:peptidoglycan L-alanyl-D-glutamate endopeptidase CwlK